MDRKWVARRTKRNSSHERKLDRRASDAWHRLLAERGLGDEDVLMTHRPVRRRDCIPVSSSSMPPMTITTKPMTKNSRVGKT